MPTLMQDHAGWSRTRDATTVRVMRSGGTSWLLVWSPHDGGNLTVTPAGVVGGSAPAADHVDPERVAERTDPLGAALLGLGPVLRVPNTDLWDAIGYAIIRQVIRASQARIMYDRFCTAHGDPVPTPHGHRHLFPTADTVRNLPDEAFTRLGMTFKARPLRAAADAILQYGPAWQRLGPAELVEALVSTPRIGPWTAGAAVADRFGDFAFYPYDDLAVRTWARRAAPTVAWPQDPTAFGTFWRRRAGKHLSALTLLTLAWGGSHAQPP